MVAMQDLDRLYTIYKQSKTEGLTLNEWHEAVELLQKIVERLANCKKCDEPIGRCDNDFLNCKHIKREMQETKQKTIMNYIER